MPITTPRIWITALAAATLGAPPAAWSADRYVFLGDSLVDNQNSYVATGLLQPSNVIPASPPYWDGRFSNGPNWTDRLAPNQLYYMDYYFGGADCATQTASNGLSAFCGATTDPGAQPGVSLSFAFGGSKAGYQQLPSEAPGMLTVIDDLSRYNTSGEVADLSGSVFAILTGGNDYTNYVIGSQTLSDQGIVDQTLDEIGLGITQVATMNPKRVVVLNLFDLSRVPTLAADFTPDQLTQVGTLSTLHNAGLPATLATARARTGADIVLVDLDALYDDIFARPSLYGFTNLTGSCLNTNGSGDPTGECPDAASEEATLFWDGQHPTTAAHRYIAELTTATLQAVDLDGGRLTALPDSALLQGGLLNAALRSAVGDVPFADRENRISHREGNRRYFVVAEGGKGERRAEQGFAGYDYDHHLLLAGVTFLPGDFAGDLELGGHLGHLAIDADLTGGGSFDNQGVALGGFLRWRRGALTYSAQASVIRLTVDDLARPTGFSAMPTARGDTDGWGLGAELEARLDRRVSLGERTINLTTFGRLGAGWARIDGYTERDAAFLDLAVEQSELGELRAGVGVTAWSEIPWRSGLLRPYLGIGLDYDLLDDRREVSAALSSGQRVDAAGEAPGRAALDLNLGLRYTDGDDFRLEAALAARFDGDGDRLRLIPRLTVSQRF